LFRPISLYLFEKKSPCGERAADQEDGHEKLSK